MASLALPIISGVGGIVSSLIGGDSAEKAANQQRAALLGSAQQINTTSANVNNQINAATASGTSGITNAATSAGGIAQAAGAAANTGIGGAVTGATGNYQPYTSAGSTAVGGLANLASGGTLGSTFSGPTAASLNDPNAPGSAGYQFTLQQGQEAIQKAAAAQGGLFSSGTLKSLAGYTTGTDNQYYNSAYQQALSTFQANQQSALNQAGVLQGLSSQGLAAAAGASNAQLQGATQQGANTINTGEYAGTAGLTGATSSGNLGLSGAVQGGGLIQSAAAQAAGYGAQAGNAQAAGTLEQGYSLQNVVGGATNALSGYLSSLNLGGGGLASSAGQTFNNLPTGGGSNPFVITS